MVGFRSLGDLNPVEANAHFLREPVLSELVRASDIVLVIVSAFTGYVLYQPVTAEFAAGNGQHYVVPAVLVSVSFSFLFHRLGGYGLKQLKQARWQVPRVIGMWILVISLYSLAAFLTKSSATYSRVWTVLWTALALALVLGQRGVVCLLLNSSANTLFKRKVAVVGGFGESLDRVLAKLRAAADEITVLGVYSDQPAVRGDGVMSISDLVRSAHHVLLDEIIIAIPIEAHYRLKAVVDRLKHLPTDIVISVETIEQTFGLLELRRVGDLATLQVVNRPLQHWGVIAKWVEDQILGWSVLLLTAPLMAVIAILIKWDSPGPVFFRQERYGFNNRVIKVLKFRTMHVEAEDRSGARRTVENDPRVTRIGHVLRRLSLDELPQIFNVLKGEMSFVGPRPHAVAMRVGDHLYHDVVAEYAQRHRVKPGVTGWAQINGLRGEVDSLEKGHARVQYDLYYIERWSLWFDLKILLLTLPAVVSRRNAF